MKVLLLPILLLLTLLSCKHQPDIEISLEEANRVRYVHDTIGFAQYSWQMDSIYSRLEIKDTPNDLKWKAAICPHDDYKYAGRLYYESLKGINANTVILIGVAHRARNFELQDKIIFGNHTQWQSPYGGLKVSSINQELMSQLSETSYIVHDSMQVLEHSLEAIVPFLHKKSREVNIVPILIPYINYETIDHISSELSKAVVKVMKEKNWIYGEDLAVVISNDAVHYGDVDWGGANLAPFGTDDADTKKARQFDKGLINTCLVGEISGEKVAAFTRYTVQSDNYKEYKWVWCGRYSVPFGLDFANKLNIELYKQPLYGKFLDYESSIDHKLIEVEDLGMGTTAIATQSHWVAYVSIKYE